MPETVFTGPSSAGVGASAVRAKGWSASFSALSGSRSNTPALYACTSSRMPRNAAASGVRNSARDGSRETSVRFASCSAAFDRSGGVPLSREELVGPPRVCPALASSAYAVRPPRRRRSGFHHRTCSGFGGRSRRLCNRRHNCRSARRRLGAWWRLERARCRSRIRRLVILPKWPRRKPPLPRRRRPGRLKARAQSRRAVTAHHRVRPRRSHAPAGPRQGAHRRQDRRASGLPMGRSFTFSPSAVSILVRTSASPSIRQKISRTLIS